MADLVASTPAVKAFEALLLRDPHVRRILLDWVSEQANRCEEESEGLAVLALVDKSKRGVATVSLGRARAYNELREIIDRFNK